MTASSAITQKLEQFLIAFKVNNTHVEFFVDPTNREIKDILKASKYREIRFLANGKDKTVIMWSSDTILHGVAMRKIGGNLVKAHKDGNIIAGIAVKLGGKLLLMSYDNDGQAPSELHIDILKDKFKWLDKAMDTSVLKGIAQDRLLK